jgi:hypothetical protein
MTVHLVTDDQGGAGLLRSAGGLAAGLLSTDPRVSPDDGDTVLIYSADDRRDRIVAPLRFHLHWSLRFITIAVRQRIPLTLVNWVSAADLESLPASVALSVLDQFARMVKASPDAAGVTPVTIGTAASEFGGPASVAVLDRIATAPQPLAGRTVTVAGGIVGVLAHPELAATVTTLKPRWEPGDIGQALRILLAGAD